MGGIGPAPFAAMMLADHGAEVIRVERAGMIGFAGDPLRRSRRSLALDLKQPEGVEILKKLAASADVLVENYRPGVAKRLGVDFEALSAENPRLIYASISGFGQEGPYRDRPGYDAEATVCAKDGRIIFSTLESQGLRSEISWGIWSIHPDGTNWNPVLSAFDPARHSPLVVVAQPLPICQ